MLTCFWLLLQVVSAYGHEPVATTSLLAYVLCHELHDSLEDKVAWLGVLGTFGDLGSSVKWDPPFPDMGSAIKHHGGKTKYSQAVSLLNARESSLSPCCLLLCRTWQQQCEVRPALFKYELHHQYRQTDLYILSQSAKCQDRDVLLMAFFFEARQTVKCDIEGVCQAM